MVTDSGVNVPELRKKMFEKKISQKALAARLGLSPMAFRNKEQGKSEFTRREIAIISELCGLSVADMQTIFFGQYSA